MQPNLEKNLEHLEAYLRSQAPALQVSPDDLSLRAVTISRQAGCGAHEIAQELAAFLQARASDAERPWTVLDRRLIEHVLKDHDLPNQLARYMPEDRIPLLQDTVEEILGLHPPRAVLIRKTVETLLRVAELGHVILLGRGANLATRKIPNILNVRLVGSLEYRIDQRQQKHGLNPDEVRRRIESEDRGRKRYVRRYFHERIDNSQLYHVVLKVDEFGPATLARWIGELALQLPVQERRRRRQARRLAEASSI